MSRELVAYLSENSTIRLAAVISPRYYLINQSLNFSGSAKNIPQKFQTDFIRGVLDGDGSISICKYRKIKNNKEYWYTKISVYICSGSKVFLEQIKNMIPENINCGLITIKPKDKVIHNRIIKTKNNMYKLQFNDSGARKLLAWLYYPHHKLSLNRKCKLANNLLPPQDSNLDSID